MAPSTMQAVRVASASAPWNLETVDVHTPGPTQVLVKVKACGICGTDIWIGTGKLSFGPFPLSLGHEGVGEVDAVGSGVTSRKVGDRVDVCTLQKGCGTCGWCKEERPLDFLTAANCEAPVLTGFNTAGGHAKYMLAYEGGTVLLPENMSYENAAPIMCAGYTVWGRLCRGYPKPGDTIAVVGIGGLGHLAIQYAKAAGFRTIAVSKSDGKVELAKNLGADEVVKDGAALKAAGGADVLLATSNSNEAVIDAMAGLSATGRTILMGIAFDSFTLTSMPVVMNSQRVIGSAHNGKHFLVQALQMAADGKVKPMVEVFPKNRIQEAVEKMSKREARFKPVIVYE